MPFFVFCWREIAILNMNMLKYFEIVFLESNIIEILICRIEYLSAINYEDILFVFTGFMSNYEAQGKICFQKMLK